SAAPAFSARQRSSWCSPSPEPSIELQHARLAGVAVDPHDELSLVSRADEDAAGRRRATWRKARHAARAEPNRIPRRRGPARVHGTRRTGSAAGGAPGGSPGGRLAIGPSWTPGNISGSRSLRLSAASTPLWISRTRTPLRLPSAYNANRYPSGDRVNRTATSV